MCLWSAYSVGTPARNARMDGVKVWDWDADTHTPACQMRHGFTMCVSQGGVWQQRDIYTYIHTLCITIPLLPGVSALQGCGGSPPALTSSAVAVTSPNMQENLPAKGYVIPHIILYIGYPFAVTCCCCSSACQQRDILYLIVYYTLYIPLLLPHWTASSGAHSSPSDTP